MPDFIFHLILWVNVLSSQLFSKSGAKSAGVPVYNTVLGSEKAELCHMT